MKKVFDKLKGADLDYLCEHTEKEIKGLKNALFKFYQAKSKESLKKFQETSGIEEKMNMNLNGKKNKQKGKKDEVIDLDHLSDE